MTRQSRIILPLRKTPSATAGSPSTSNSQIRPFVPPLIRQSPIRCTWELRCLFLARSEPDQRFVDLNLRAIGELLLFAERTYIRVEEDSEILTRLEEKPEGFAIVVVLEPGDGDRQTEEDVHGHPGIHSEGMW